MPSQRYFDQHPAFPSDVEVADIPTVSLRQLENNSQPEAIKLFEACRHHGFFSLDLQNSQQGTSLLADAEKMFDLATETLNLDKPLLNTFAYHPPADLIGYKRTGLLRTDDGNLDVTEMYTIGQDDILGTVLPARRNPQPVETHRSGCQDFFIHARAAIATILTALDRQLAIPAGTLAGLTALDKPSVTGLRLLLTQPQQASPRRVTLGAHTDIGLITLLFHVAGGLQILPVESENTDANWRFVRPRVGCALVNLGDTIVEWTGGVLRSALHRVVTAPGGQHAAARVSLAYLVRPAHGESMRRLPGDGKVIPLAEEGEEDMRTVDEWAAERSAQIGDGVLRARGSGGVRVVGK